MKKNFLSVTLLVTSLLVGSFLSIATTSFNQNRTDLIESTIDEENEKISTLYKKIFLPLSA